MTKKEASKIAQKYYNFTNPIAEFFTRPQNIELKEVDFEKPWWKFLFQFKGMIVLGNINEAINASISVSIPFIIAHAVSTTNYSLVWVIIGMYTGGEILNRVVFTLLAQTETVVENSIIMSGLTELLRKDPIIHVFKSTGNSLSKLNKGASAYRTLLWMLNDGLVSAVIGFIVTIATLSFFSWQLGLTAFIFFSLYTLVSFVFGSLTAKTFGKHYIKVDDAFQGSLVESMTQIQFIRSLFATNEQLDKVSGKSQETMDSFVKVSFSYGLIRTARRIISYTATGIIVAILISMVSTGAIEPVTALAITSSFLLGLGRVSSFGNLIRDFIERVQRVNTLFDYIRDFGPQTYPVLEGDKVEE